MQITAIQAIPLQIPLLRPAAIATRQLKHRDFVLVRVQTDAGIEGIGYTYAGTTGGRTVATAIADVLAPLLRGTDPRLVTAHWEAMAQESLLIGRKGALMRAISAVDIALWDFLGKLADQPLYRLLGGFRDAVPAYASGGYYRPAKGLPELAQELETYAALGFTDFKIKVGGVPLAEDAERVRVSRETIGPRGRLALDANNAYRTAADAIRAGRAFERYDIWWFEEPLLPDDVAGHAEIARALDMPVATGEIEANRWGFRDLIAQRAADILQPDAGVLGGVTEWLRVAHAADTFNVPVAPHWHADLHAHLAAATANCLTVEYFLLEEDIYNFERILAERTRPRDGLLPLPQRPGVGLVLDEAAIARYRVG